MNSFTFAIKDHTIESIIKTHHEKCYRIIVYNANNIFNWYLALYRFYRGSLRFKILFEVFSEHELTVDMGYRDWETDRKSTRLNSSHSGEYRMPSSA